MGRISAISVLAGALCGLAALEVLVAIAGAVGVAINGGTSFATMGERQFKTTVAVVLVAACFCSFLLGGYVSGRMSRRRGATHGVLAGGVGAALTALGAAAVIGTGTDNGLAQVARHMQVVATWQQWRSFAFVTGIVAVVAMVLGGLTGSVEGERWHGKLLARAVDPSYGPEAEEQAAARKRTAEAEAARLAAAGHVGRLTGAAKVAPAPTTSPVAPAPAPAPVAPVAPVAQPTWQPTGPTTTRRPARAAAVTERRANTDANTDADDGQPVQTPAPH